MDGGIREINKSVFDSGSDTGVPSKKPKLELSANDVGICSDVMAKLNVSSPQIQSPDTARTVSSTDSSFCKTPHAFDFRFVTNDDDVRQLLVAQTCDEHRDVTLISHPDDLSQANLVSRLSISGEGRHTLYPGKLFEGSQPLTLVIDIRKLTSEDLPKFNDLLDPDNPCLYDKVSKEKRPLGEHVALLVLADPEQLRSVGRLDDAPGADFWRRINRPDNTWQLDAKTGNAPSLEINEVPPLLAELPSAETAMDDNTFLINCHLHNHWRQLLLGGPGVDKQGRIRHIPGRLESLRSGQRVILKGADWGDLAFEQTIRQMLAHQCFESNGEICPLPDDVQFYQMPVGDDELYSLFQNLSHSHEKNCEKEFDKKHAPQNPIIINRNNIRDWLSPIAIHPEGIAVPNTSLLEQVRAGGAVTVTSPLTEALWFRLLGSLQTIRETTGVEPLLQVAHSKHQPKALGLAENDEQPLSNLLGKMRARSAFNTFTYQQAAQASHWLNNHPEAPLVIRVNEQTSFSQLFDNIHITSEQKAYFGRRQSKLQEALTAGQPVLLRGLETNPMLQQLLEPLVVGQPLLVNGQLQTYPQAHVTMLWPESVKSPSSIFRSMVAKGKSCPEVDLWEINAVKHKISRAELPEQALNKLYQAFETVPAHLCNPLPEMTEGLLQNLILAARRAQQLDQSLQLLPRHWRKAIDSVITHGTRQNPSVRDFMKVACWHLLPDKTPDEDQTASVDPDRLNAIINSSLRLDRKFVRQNLWQLARALDPAVFKGTELQLAYEHPFPAWGEENVLDRLCAMILAHRPEKQRDALAYQFEIDPKAAEEHPPLAIRPSRQIKRLQDALASGWQLILPSGQTRSDALHALASDCFHGARTANSKTEDIERIKRRLSESLIWQGSADMPLSALARDLYHGEISQKDRESRRLSRLYDRLTDSPVIFLQGETGTGKSYFSAKMAKASGQASVISLGPSDSEQTLMKRWQWQQHADGDRSMVQQNRVLMEWASTESDKDASCIGGEYITLVLDEANLAQTGLLASLNGLWEPQPCIYVNGHPVKVSPKHRVILTGNPDHYAGRQMDPALKEKLPTAYYPRLDQAFLRDRVVEPALVKHLQRHLLEHQINDIAHRASNSLMALWQYYQELLPEHEFTPRDLTDICSWVGWYLDRALPARGSVTCEQINSLIQHSFRDVLGSEITETHQDALSALEIWFAARYHPNNTLSNKVHDHTLQDMQQTFSTVSREIRPDFDTSGSAVCELVQWLGQDLSRCQQAYHLNRKHGGRQATLIEGPAGRGKDATLNLVIESVRQEAKRQGESMPEVFYLNACDCSWDKVCEKIQKAKIEGGIVVISEMNLIDSQHLEGELNDILAGDAHPGFHLFATINPPEYSGRKPLSPALKGRFRHLPIRQYNPAELQAIAEKVLPQDPQGKIAAKWLTEKHCRLRAYLQRRKLPLQPTSLDLQNVARAVNRGGDFSDKALHQYLNQHYRLYLMAANRSLKKLPDLTTLAMGKGAPEPELSHWFYQTVSGIDRPWLIRLSDRNSIDEKHHEIRINTLLDKEEAKTEIIRLVAQARWLKSGLSLKPNQSDDILNRALYRHCQQHWFNHEFERTGVDANSVFPLTEEEEQTLKLPASQPFLQEAERRISAWNSNAIQLWPGFWHQLMGQPSHWVEVSEKYNSEVHEKQAPTLDQSTNYENRQVPKVIDYKIFNSRHPSHMYRWWARDINVTVEGDVELIDMSDQDIQRVEPLTPALLPEYGQEVTLTGYQTLATLSLRSKNGQYALPSLTPDDYIVALRTKPDFDFKLVRDRCTGLHTLTIPEAKANQSILIAYIVEEREPGISSPDKEALSKRLTASDTHCSEGMKKVLNDLFSPTSQHPTESQELLQAIKNAKSKLQRIWAINHYCRQFSGKSEPEESQNFFQFLVTERQGSCRHRVPVFVALCRYFGIPCRQIDNSVHCFAEYSEDGGQTWVSLDLGGAPLQTIEIRPDFQPTGNFGNYDRASKKIRNLLKDLLKSADSAQQQALAMVLGMNLEALKIALETNRAFRQAHMTVSEMVERLWLQKDLAGFSMGVLMLESLATEALGDDEKALAGSGFGNVYDERPMSDAVKAILSNSDEDQVSEPLKSLHSKIIVQGGASPHPWLKAMLDILNSAGPSVILFAREAMASGWLDPLPYDKNYPKLARKLHDQLVGLKYFDELKVEADHCLKKWYQAFLSREKNSQSWQLFYKRLRKKTSDISTFFITHGHDGFSSFLEGKITNSSVETAWTDNPEGIPNIERMLVHNPAFVQLISGKANHRPVIITGKPDWDETLIRDKIKALCRQKVEKRPDLQPLGEEKLVDNLKDKCKQAIQQAYSHYLYELTHSKGGSLTYCWIDAFSWGTKDRGNYGTHDPSSPGELYSMMSEIDTYSSIYDSI
ncbi:AAA family ATPase [Endozoicomonas sp. ALB032]|uniref:AAA family ATPase n=1 Tax=Endozoicomonas sp. ALB032 TaxID=3403082 RepID=UPI003BB6048E